MVSVIRNGSHATGVVDTLGRQRTDKQLLVALTASGGPSIYAYANAVAAAAGRHVGFGTGISIANGDAVVKPAACNPRAKITICIGARP